MHKIAVIPGDGIGPEVIDEGIKTLNLIEQLDPSIQFQFDYFEWSCEYYHKHGKMMPENGIDQLSHYDAIYLGAVGFPGVPDHISLWDLLLVIRKQFDQYVNIRPIKLFKSPQDTESPNVDMLFIRENTEGEYSGAGDWLYKGQDNEVVLQTAVFSRKGTERIIRYAFEVAKKQGKTLTSISKANALNYSMVFWDEVFEEVSKEYPTVDTASYLVDAAAMLMISDPERFEVVVTSNLFGDILTDLGAALAGGMGLAAGANVNPTKKYPSMFEPVHGSAPDIAGQGLSNPLAAIWSASQMLDHLGYNKWAKQIIDAIEEVVIKNEVVTQDLGGNASTEEVGDILRSTLKTLS